MTAPEDLALDFVTADTYARVQQFYAYQMGLMDEREAERWADTFTEDAVFEEPHRMEPLRGRDAIKASARASADRLADQEVRMRHWLGMLQVLPQPDQSLRTRSYALAMRIPKGGDLDIFVSVVCRDHLVPHQGSWLVRHRHLTHDGSYE